MSRPRKFRKVCSLPSHTDFGPIVEDNKKNIIMTVDEYETIRLIDYEIMTQEECAEQMGVARTTVQAIYAGARKKLAHYIVHGHGLKIDGGDIRLCENYGAACIQCCNLRRKNLLKKEDEINERVV